MSKPSVSSNYPGSSTNALINIKGGLGSKLGQNLGNKQGKSYMQKLMKK